MTDDAKTYIIIGAAAFVSLVAWLALVVVPAWKSYGACATGSSRPC